MGAAPGFEVPPARRSVDFRMSDWLNTALEYARDGLPVFPLHGIAADPVTGEWRCTCPRGAQCVAEEKAGKHPRTDNGHRNATTDEATIRAWADVVAQGLPCNLGVVVPEGYAVIDVDPRNGGWESLATLEQHFGPIPRDRVAATGSGGLHVWVRVPDGVRLPGKLSPGIDVKSSGAGYVVGVGSTHWTGGTYQWLSRGAVPMSPAWIVAAGTRKGQSTTADRDAVVGGVDVAETEIDAVVSRLLPQALPGEKHALCWELGSWLAGRGWSAAAVEATTRRLLEQCTDVRDLEAGVRTALDGTRYVGGWSRIAARFGADAEALDRETANPRMASVEENAALVEAGIAEFQSLTVTPGAIGDPYFGLPLMPATEPLPLPKLIGDLDIVPGMTTLIVGKPAASKTPFGLSLALALGSGEQWHGRDVVPTRAIYLAFEKPAATTRKRVRIARAMGVDPLSVELLNMRGKSLSDRGVVATVSAIVQYGGRPTAVFLDTYGAAVLGVNHHEAAFADPLRAAAEELCGVAGAAFIPLVHAKKASQGGRDDIAGTVHLLAAVDAAIGLSQHDESDPYVVDVTSVRPAEDGFAGFQLRWVNVSAPAVDGAAGDVGDGGDPRWGLGFVEPESSGERAMGATVRVTMAQAVDAAVTRIQTYMQGVDPTILLSHAELCAVARSTRRIAEDAVTACVRHEIVTRIPGRVPRYSRPNAFDRPRFAG